MTEQYLLDKRNPKMVGEKYLLFREEDLDNYGYSCSQRHQNQIN